MKSRSRLAAWMCDGSFFQYIGTAFLPLDFSQLKIMKHYCQVILNGDCFAPKSGRAGT